MVSSKAILVATLVSVALAQDNTTKPYNGSLTVDPNSIDGGMTRRRALCQGQQNTCIDLCGGTGEASTNDCDQATLEWSCTCRNGTSPDVVPYDQSMPAQLCELSVEQCVVAVIAQFPSGANVQQQEGVYNCRDQHCGDQNSTEVRVGGGAAPSGASPSSTSSGSPTQQTGASQSSSAPAQGSQTGAAALVIAQSYGTSIFAAGLLVAFGLAL